MFNIMECYYSIWIFILFCLVTPYFVNGSCKWPTEFQNTTWKDSSKGDIEFTTDKLSGWTITISAVSPPQQFDSWLCHSTELYASHNILVLITEETFQAYGDIFYGFLCMELYQVTTASYRYYLHNVINQGVNYERIQMVTSDTESNLDTLCLFDDKYASYRPTDSEYRLLINNDNVLDARINCPYVFLGSYGYTHTDTSGTVTCDSSMTTWSTCNGVTEMTFDYSTCATEIAYSKSNTVWCVDTVSYGDDNYVTVYNGNDQDADIDNINTYRFACIAISADASSASVAPGSCTNGQTPDSIPSNGISDVGAILSLVQTDTCVTCPVLQAPSSGSVSYSTNGAVTIATYTCSEEYSLAGPEVRTCQDNNTWTDEDPTCTCILPEPPANGSLVASTDGILTYYCDVGFVLIGDQTRTCQTNANTWSGVEPVCDLCEVLDAADGLVVDMTTTGTTSVSMFTCSVGYTLDGSYEATCHTSGSWNATVPTCVRCDNITSSDIMEVVFSSDGVSSTAVFDCVTGYQRIGERNATCDITGAWSQVPSCECEEPDTPVNGTMARNGTTATFSCDVGHNLVGSKTIVCLDDGSGWSDVSPTCNICSTLLPPNGGYYNLSSDGSVTMATYSCFNSYTLSGEQTSFCQNNGFWNNTSPTCVKCPDLTIPSSGIVEITTDGQTSEAQYSCMEGYNISGSTNSTCSLDGTWSNNPPTCYCSRAVVPEGGMILSDDGELVYYECNVNYSMNGDSVRECATNGSGWSGQDTTCVACDSFSSVKGGTVELFTDGINTKAAYACDTGYSIDGKKQITCQSNGSWSSEQSNCTQCTYLSIPSNGNYTMLRYDYETITKAAYTCDVGYTLVGYSELTCESTGSWNRAPPTCVKCEVRNSPSSGNFSLMTDGLQTTGVYTCADGYELVGVTSVACATNGLWDGQESTCECITPNAPNNGSVVFDQPTVYYSCDTGFTMSGESIGVCNPDGTGWGRDTPTCVECASLGNVDSGNVTFTSNGETTMVEVTCDAGTSLMGNALIVCNDNGTWDSELPECVMCADLPELTVTSGSVTIATSGTTTTANYECPEGYKVHGLQTIECQANGTWSDSPSECVCEAPVMSEGGEYIISTNGMFVTYACAEGYTIDGVLTAECATDGSGWMLEYPNCSKCENVALPQNGNVTLGTNGTHTSVEYSCDVGYTLNDVTISECQADGTWTSTTTTEACELCESLPAVNVVNGSVTLESNGTHTLASYTCPPGYEVKGAQTITCNGNGTWDIAPSECVCETPPAIAGGNFTVADDGYSVIFNCDEGYTIAGNQEITCATDGSGWTLSYPSCSKCNDLIAPNGGNVALVTNGTVSTAVYTCDIGTSISGVSVTECQADGAWNMSEPTCVSCPSLPNVTIATGNIEITSNGITTTAYYHCPYGYKVRGVQNITCTSDGTWSEDASDCVCATPLLPVGGNYTLSADGLIVTFECEEGYTMVGVQTVSCEIDGSGWNIEHPNCTMCEDLTPPSGGDVSLTTDGTQTVAIYSCDVGSTLNGEYTPQCSTDGTWTSVQAQCVNCQEVTNITSGNVNISTNGTTTTAEYTCDTGYSMDGQAVLTCLANGSWDEQAPSCFCSAPSSPSSGSVTANKTTAVYSCYEGFTLKGSTIRTCQDDGLSWTGTAPSCFSCDTIIAPADGAVTLNTDGIVTMATFTCEVGFTMNGSEVLTCLEDGSWSHQTPNCVQCTEPSEPTDGAVNNTTNGTHTIAVFTCNVGSSIRGADTSVCLEDTTWSSVEPLCDMCPPLTSPSSGNVSMATDGLTTTAHFTCADGYYVEGSDVITCLDDGSWSDSSPFCLCDEPALSNGRVSSNGQSSTFQCDVGYSLSGVFSLTCVADGNGWNNSIPSCVECLGLIDPIAGKHILSSDGLNTRATFECEVGWSLSGSDLLQCYTGGLWNGSVPTCVQCDDLTSPTTGQFVMSSDGRVTSVELKCNEGYEASGVTTAQCGVDGTWYFQEESTCDAVESTDKSLLTILIVVSVGSVVIIVVLAVLLARFVYLYFQNKSYSAEKYSSDISPFDSSENVSNGIWKTLPTIKVLQSRAPTSHQRHVMETESPFAPSPAPDGFVKSPTFISADSPPPIETHRSGSSIISFRRSATTVTKNSHASVSAVTIAHDDDKGLNNDTSSQFGKTNGIIANNCSEQIDKPPNRLTPLPNHRAFVGKLKSHKTPSPENGLTSQSEIRSGTPLVMKHSMIINDYDDLNSMDSVSIIDD